MDHIKNKVYYIIARRLLLLKAASGTTVAATTRILPSRGVHDPGSGSGTRCTESVFQPRAASGTLPCGTDHRKARAEETTVQLQGGRY